MRIMKNFRGKMVWINEGCEGLRGAKALEKS
jgi:hypothetical protein